MPNVWFSILAIGVAVLSLFASLAIVRGGFYTKSQAVAQIAIVWLVPVFGAVLVYLVMSSNRPARSQSVGANPDNWQNAQEHPHADPHAP